MRAAALTEPATTAAGAAAWKLGLIHKLVALFAAGAVGAAVIAAFDVPASRGRRFLQAAVAGLAAMLFTLPSVRALDAWAGWIDLSAGDPAAWLEVALPVGFIIGALSWGAFGALYQLRQLIQARAASELARRVGMTD